MVDVFFFKLTALLQLCHLFVTNGCQRPPRRSTAPLPSLLAVEARLVDLTTYTHTMLKKSTVQLMALGLVGSFVATAAAQDSGALIDALVRKGVLKDQEAEQIRAQMTRDFSSNTSAGKLNLSSSVKELKLSGDVRLRFQHDVSDTQADSGSTNAGVAGVNTNNTQRDRWRLRLRINADYKVSDNWFAGFGLQTEQVNDSGNQTMANGAPTTVGSAGGDYFSNYQVFISKAFLGWNPTEGVTLIGGKFANPFYTTDMVWDPDINPTGFAQRVDLHKFFNLGGLELSLVAGQFIVADGNEALTNSTSTVANAGAKNRDSFVYQAQLIAAANVAEGVKLTVAPGFYWTNGGALVSTTLGGGAGNGNGGANGLGVAAAGTTWTNQDALQGLKIVLLPGDVSTTLFGVKTKFLWDFAYNTDGSERSRLYGSAATPGGALNADQAATVVNPVGTDKLAYLFGVSLGENKKKGDWSFIANYRQVGLSSVDPAINDSDWALSYTNMAGCKAGFFYNIGDATTIGATYFAANNLRKELGVASGRYTAGPGSQQNSVQVLQLDVNVKF